MAFAQETFSQGNDPAPSAELLPVSFTIVVPTFRRQALLPPLFAAVATERASIPEPVELLLIDNSPEASAKAAAAAAPAFVRYVHEPQTGVARARNRGVAEAAGTHVIFLDDDETPAAGWLYAFARAARQGAKAAFGAVEPRFETDPPAALRGPLDRVFSRRLPAADGAEVQHLRAYLGSGNSMFAKATLALVDPPFDTAFDRGGEDVWLFRRLVDDHQIPMLWCPGALVQEIVPASRASLAFLRARRFSDGQLRCLVESGHGGLRGAARVALWMAVGGAQVLGHGLAALLTRSFSPTRSTHFQLAACGGAGKILWWRRKLVR
ncbi:glycosyltransferase [Rhodobacter sp. SY28-1]|uniref:glycosyltransferase n=1 Tax=Rhodobacter sp. SY28-1 TaxID=2562317 RepID=UPI0010BFD223|nr:glycosyltransferase [Rhodobacter sp. SY28-1]